MKRSYSIDTSKKIGEKVKVFGWVDSIRDHGQLIFIDLRDYKGKVQIVADPSFGEVFEQAKGLSAEFVISVTGTVRKRSPELVNKNIETGEIELVAEELELLNRSKPLPFPINTNGHEIDENLRLKYRYIDLRRERIKRNMQNKHKFLLEVRNWMSENGFLEVMTPLLTSTSPEGARDFVVPSRLFPGKFFVLPQAPQQYKQLLMVGGVDKYFQIAPCARDEDPRADRHAGIFYQIDLEMSFPTIDDLFSVCEEMIRATYKVVAAEKTISDDSFVRIPYRQSMDRFGSDKPDLRFGMELREVTEIVKDKTDFNIFNSAENVKCIVASGCGNWSRTQISEMEEFAKREGAKGLAFVKVEKGKLDGGIAKFLSSVEKELVDAIDAKDGDLVFFGADEREIVNKVLGQVRLKLADILELKDKNKLTFAWITDFPFYEVDEKTGKLDFGHNPFSMPKGGIEAFDVKDPLTIESLQYDLALNGYEILSGSIRNHSPEILIKAFEKVGYGREEILKRFGGLYNAFQYGAPPHGGWAIGFDRFFMILSDEPNIRDTYAFPKSQSGQDLMMNAPSEITKEQLEELNISVNAPQIRNGRDFDKYIVGFMKNQGIDFEHITHKETKTSVESAEVRGTDLQEGAKALILKSDTSHVMVVVPADKQVEISKIESRLDSKVSLESPDIIKSQYGLDIGAVPPIGTMFGMKVYVDNKLFENERIAFNSGLRTSSIIMNPKDLSTVMDFEKGDFVE